MSGEILERLKREGDICVKTEIPSQNTAFRWNPALIKLQRRFDQIPSAFIGFFKKSDGFLTIHSSAVLTLFVSRVVLSLCEYQASRKRLSWKLRALSTIVAWSKCILYGQICSRVAQLWNCCLQPEPPFYFILTLFPRLCQSVHSERNCNQRSRPCKQHLCTARQRVCPLVSLESRYSVGFLKKTMNRLKAEVVWSKRLWSFINVVSNVNKSQCQAQILILMLSQSYLIQTLVIELAQFKSLNDKEKKTRKTTYGQKYSAHSNDFHKRKNFTSRFSLNWNDCHYPTLSSIVL